MKICLFGASGLLGSEFEKIFVEQKLNFIAPSSHEISLLQHDKVLAYLKAEKPDLIINCAAYTAVDKAEKEPEICFKLNAGSVETLMAAGIPLINFSTDYVFNAPAGIEIPEDYPRDPQSVYGQSKAEAEEILEASNTHWWNIRTSWLWGPEGNNFVSTINRLSEKYDEIKVIDDQIGRPTYALELAALVVEQFVTPQIQSCQSSNSKGQVGKGVRTHSPGDRSRTGDRSQLPKPGHYHLQNQGAPVSWAGFAQYFLVRQGWQGTIKKITTEEYGAAAPRPKNSVLKNTKLKNNLKDWKTRFKSD